MNLKKMGFTLIKLTLVIVALILLLKVKFLNYIETTKVTQIIHDIKVVGNMILAQYIRTGTICLRFLRARV